MISEFMIGHSNRVLNTLEIFQSILNSKIGITKKQSLTKWMTYSQNQQKNHIKTY